MNKFVFIATTVISVAMTGCVSIEDQLNSQDPNVRVQGEYRLLTNARLSGKPKEVVSAINRIQTKSLLLELFNGVPPDVADGNLALLGVLLGLLGQLLTALLGQGREHQADLAAVILGIDAQVRGQDGLLDALEHGAVPGLDQQGAGVRRGNGGW